jgi:hypothetical protein
MPVSWHVGICSLSAYAAFSSSVPMMSRHQSTAIGGRHRSPRAPERATRAAHGTIDVNRVACGDRGKDVARARIDHRHGLPGRCGGKLAVDEDRSRVGRRREHRCVVGRGRDC